MAQKHDVNNCCGTTCDQKRNLRYVQELEARVAAIPEQCQLGVLEAIQYALERHYLQSQEGLSPQSKAIVHSMEQYAMTLETDQQRSLSALVGAKAILLALADRVKTAGVGRTYTPWAVSQLLVAEAAALETELQERGYE